MSIIVFFLFHSCSEIEAINSLRIRKPVECYLNRTKKSLENTWNQILLSVRTTASYHSQRLPLLFQTWLSTVNTSNVVIVTDGDDDILRQRALEAGYHANYNSGTSDEEPSEIGKTYQQGHYSFTILLELCMI